jgi:hypothetical protein
MTWCLRYEAVGIFDWDCLGHIGRRDCGWGLPAILPGTCSGGRGWALAALGVMTTTAAVGFCGVQRTYREAHFDTSDCRRGVARRIRGTGASSLARVGQLLGVP